MSLRVKINKKQQQQRYLEGPTWASIPWIARHPSAEMNRTQNEQQKRSRS
jgi:hypothetical protein